MSNSADVIVAFMEMLEAEARGLKQDAVDTLNSRGDVLRQSILKMLSSVLLLIVAMVLVLFALLALLWALYLSLSGFLAPPMAALVCGLATLFLSVLVALAAKWRSR